MLVKKRYLLPPEQCEVDFYGFYKNAAAEAGFVVTDKTVFDCRKICITQAIFKALSVYYYKKGCTGLTFGELMVMYGPKANLLGDGYEFEIEDGFVTETE